MAGKLVKMTSILNLDEIESTVNAEIAILELAANVTISVQIFYNRESDGGRYVALIYYDTPG